MRPEHDPNPLGESGLNDGGYSTGRCPMNPQASDRPGTDNHERRPRRWRRSRVTAIVAGAGAVCVLASLAMYGLVGGASDASAVKSVTPAAASPISTVGFPTGAGDTGIFTDRCGFSHEAADDPILAPKQAGASMHHDFFGNTSTSASTTASALLGRPTTCTTSADSSAYWTPVLYQRGKSLTPSTALIYWRRPARDTQSVHTIPAGLQMIAGDEAATTPQATKVTAWSCKAKADRSAPSPTPRNCPGSDLRLTVTFPSCWDGHTLGGATQTNVVYSTGTGCPADHPIQIPQIVFHVTYPTSDASGLTLSMSPTMQGSTDTMHVDFINGWNQNILTRNVTACIATSTRCGPVTGAQAVPQGGKSKPATRQHHRQRKHAH